MHELKAEAENAHGVAKEDLLDQIDQIQDKIDESNIKAACTDFHLPHLTKDWS